MWKRCLGTLALCTLTAGCQLAENAIKNVSYEFQLKAAEVAEHCNYEKLAQASWETVQTTEGHEGFSKLYAEGYRDGFVDYLEFGGTGLPPYVPPRRFWGPTYRTPEGYQSIQDWYAGFRHGTTAAQQSGYRKWVTLPSARNTEPPPVLPEGPVQPIPPVAPVAKPGQDVDVLPPPTPLKSTGEPGWISMK